MVLPDPSEEEPGCALCRKEGDTCTQSVNSRNSQRQGGNNRFPLQSGPSPVPDYPRDTCLGGPELRRAPSSEGLCTSLAGLPLSTLGQVCRGEGEACFGGVQVIAWLCQPEEGQDRTGPLKCIAQKVLIQHCPSL